MMVIPTLSVARLQDQHAISRHDQAKKQKNERLLMTYNFRQYLFEDIALTCPGKKVVAASKTVCTVVYVKNKFFSAIDQFTTVITTTGKASGREDCVPLSISAQNVNSLNISSSLENWELKVGAIKKLGTDIIFISDLRLKKKRDLI
jgi:hypothetical protein